MNRVVAALCGMLLLVLGTAQVRAQAFQNGAYGSCTVALGASGVIDLLAPTSGVCQPGGIVFVTMSGVYAYNLTAIKEDVPIGATYKFAFQYSTEIVNYANTAGAGNIWQPGGEGGGNITVPGQVDVQNYVWTQIYFTYRGPHSGTSAQSTPGWVIDQPGSGFAYQWYLANEPSGAMALTLNSSMTLSTNDLTSSYDGFWISPTNYAGGLTACVSPFSGSTTGASGNAGCNNLIFDNNGHTKLGNTNLAPTIASNACGSTTQGVFKSGTQPTDQGFTVEVGTTSVGGVSSCVITLARPYSFKWSTVVINTPILPDVLGANFHGNTAAIAVDHSGATVVVSTSGTCPSCSTIVTITATGATKLDGAEIAIGLN